VILTAKLGCLPAPQHSSKIEGPEYKKIGPLVRYRYLAVLQWVESQPIGGNGHRIEPSTHRILQRTSNVSRRIRPLKPQNIRVSVNESQVG
jgi:hypothetical protein